MLYDGPLIRRDDFWGDLGNTLLLRRVYRAPAPPPPPEPQPVLRLPEPKPEPVKLPNYVGSIHECKPHEWGAAEDGDIYECPDCKAWWLNNRGTWEKGSLFEKTITRVYFKYMNIRKKL